MIERTGYNSIRTKNRNRGIVLRLIAVERLSRAEITKRIGLTKMAVTKIVSELIEDGYVVEGKSDAPTDGGVGRTPTALRISPTAPVALGLYISRAAVSALIATLDAKYLFETTLPLREETRATLTEKIFTVCDRVLRRASVELPGNRLLGVGVSAIGPLDPNTGAILDPTDFFGITEFPVAELLGRRYGLPVILENDMNAAAIAERHYGVGRTIDNFMYVGITNGIGAGIILDGYLCRHGCKSVGEIGHMSINCEGPVCSCGNRGCLEVYTNLPVIRQQLKETVGSEVLPMDFSHYDRFPAVAAIFDRVTGCFTTALVNAVNFLDLDSVVIGHEGIYMPDRFYRGLEEQVNARILSRGYKEITVSRSTFGDSAPLFGSACLVFDHLFGGNILA